MRKLRKALVFGALGLSTSTVLAEEVRGAEPDATASGESSPEATGAAPAPQPAAPSAPAPPPAKSDGAVPAQGSAVPAGSVLSLVARGDAAFMERDLDGACAAYQGAAMLDPKAAVPQLRLAECQVALGKLSDAVQSSELGLRVVEPHSRLQLAALSRQAAICEMRGELEKALTTYQLLLATVPAATDAAARTLFERVGRERSIAIETRKRELAEAAIVKARADQDLADATPKS